MHAVLDRRGKKPASLYGRPGNLLFANVGAGAGRGGFVTPNSRAFAVSGAELYEISSNGTGTLRGNLNTSAGSLTFADNGFQQAICDGTDLYIFTYATNALVRVVSANLPSAASVTFLGGYFIVNRALNSGIFQISSPYDGLSWAALDFATAESSPDSLLRVVNVFGQLWLVGSGGIEVWSNTGAASFPFQRLNSAANLAVGTIAPDSCLQIDNTLLWIGRDNNGAGIVYRADGFSPQRISDEATELQIQSAPDITSLKAMSYQEAGHTYYIITGGGMETARIYDISTKLWFEWSYLNSLGQYELPLTNYLFYAFGQTLALDRNNGNIYYQSQSYFSDNGDEIACDRVFTHIFDDGNPFLIKNLVLNFETGVGNTTIPSPKVMLYLSNDGGRTFYTYYETALGKIGKFLTRAVFWRLGRHRQCTFRVRVTDSVKRVITGGQFNV